MKIVLLLPIFFFVVALPSWASKQAVNGAVVKIYTVSNPHSYMHPWKLMGQRNVNGSGCIINKKRILTNAHVVSDAMFIQVRRAGKAEKIPARIVAMDHDCDLAVLTVDDASFFSGVEPVPLGELPEIQDRVAVYGFPEGGDKISITVGVISRIEHVNYAHSGAYLLACQMDAPINAGNSGGPVIKDGKIVGVAFQAMSGGDYENIGYMVPVPVIRHFFRDLADGHVDGVPDLGVSMEKLENPAIRKFYRMKKEETGGLVIKIYPDSPALNRLRRGDVILSVDGWPVANDGTIEFRKGQRTYFGYIVQQKNIGDSVALEVLREGSRIKVDVVLDRSLGIDRLVPNHQYDKRPRYIIFGGLVFEPLVLNYLQEFSSGPDWYNYAPADLLDLYINGEPDKDRHEVVILTEVLPDSVNIGYHEIGCNIIKSVNGVMLSSFTDLVRVLDSARQPFIIFEDYKGFLIILDRKQAESATSAILSKYQIGADRFLGSDAEKVIPH